MIGQLILGRRTVIDDINCTDEFAYVSYRGSGKYKPVPYDAISWVTDDWFEATETWKKR